MAAWTSVYPLYSEWVAPNVDKYKYNVADASKKLDELGFKKRGADGIRVDSKGNRLSFTLLTNSENNRRQQMAQIFADEAKKAGVEVKTNFIPFNQALEIIYPTDGGVHDRPQVRRGHHRPQRRRLHQPGGCGLDLRVRRRPQRLQPVQASASRPGKISRSTSV